MLQSENRQIPNLNQTSRNTGVLHNPKREQTNQPTESEEAFLLGDPEPGRKSQQLELSPSIRRAGKTRQPVRLNILGIQFYEL